MKSLAAAPILAPVECSLTVINGKDKGSVYRLMAPEISVGRGSDNDIVIAEDPHTSRKHARIFLTPEGFNIESLSEKNSITVDGRKTQKAKLMDGSQVEIGNTQFKFKVVQNQMVPHMPAGPMAQPGWTPQVHQGGIPGPMPYENRNQYNRKKQGFFTTPRIMIGVVALLGIYFATADTTAVKKKMIELRTNQQIEADIEALNKATEAENLERSKKQTNTQAYKESQAAYVRGFRDYQKGVYGRAMESFQACLSLMPEHQLCNRYLRMSQRKFNELTQYHMVLGRKYREQNQFSACASSFSNVMVMIADRNNKSYQEAKANYDACQAKTDGRF